MDAVRSGGTQVARSTQAGARACTWNRWTALALLLAVAVAAAAGACTAAAAEQVSSSTDSAAVRPSMELRLLSTPSFHAFLSRIALQYMIQRPEMRVVLLKESMSAAAFDRLAQGAAHLAVTSLVPTAADQRRAPDLVSMPMFAFAYVAITHVPGLGAIPVVLDVPVLCRIYRGDVTQWDDPALVALNPRLAVDAAGQAIEVVLSGEAMSAVLDFTSMCPYVDPPFGAIITPSSKPAWPRHLYARSTTVPDATGPTSYVVHTAHTISLVLSSTASKLGAAVAPMLSRDGVLVRPSYASVHSATASNALMSARDAQGHISYSFSNTLSYAPGHSWPLVAVAMMAFPRTFVRDTCRQRAELVKFIKWIFDDDSIRYGLGLQDDSVLIPESVSILLGMRPALDSMSCGPLNRVNVDSAYSITAGSERMSTTHPVPRDILATMYSQSIGSGVTVRDVVTDPDKSLSDMQADALGQIDLTFFFPQAYKRLYPGHLEAQIRDDLIKLMPFSAYGVIPSYSFSPATLALLNAAQALPLKVDMETLGGIFTGAIRSWTDPALTSFNPALGTVFSGAATPESQITLVLCGVGDRAAIAESGLSNALMLSLNRTDAVRQSGLDWYLPADWRPVMARLDALGATYLLVESEIEMEAAVARIPGAVGYKLSFSSTANPDTDFALVRFVEPSLEAAPTATAEDLQPYNVTVLGVPSSFVACAEAAERIEDGDLDLQAVGWSSASSAAGCWPITLLVSVALPTDISADSSLGSSDSVRSRSLELLCESQTRVSRWAQYLLLSPIGSLSEMTGYSTLSTVPWVADMLRTLLNGVECGGEPILYTPSIMWSIPGGLRLFGLVTSGVIIMLTLLSFVLVLKYRSRSIIRTGDLPLQICMLLGIFMLLWCPILFVLEPSRHVCELIGFALCVGFTFVFAPIAAKIWRVHAAYKQRRSLKIRQVSLRHMYAFVALCVVVDLVLLNARGTLMVADTSTQLKDSRVHEYEQCTTSEDALVMGIALVAIKGAMLLVTSVWAVGVRHVSSAFGESTNLSWAVWNTTLSSAILAIILALVGGGAGDVHTFLLIFLLVWVAATTLLFAFGKKLAALLSEEWRSAAEASRLSRTSRTSYRNTSNTSGVTTGSGVANSAFQLPSLDAVPLAVLEKYMTALETQLRLAMERRRQHYGSYMPALNSGLGSSMASGGGGASHFHSGGGWADSKVATGKSEIEAAADRVTELLGDHAPLQQPQWPRVPAAPGADAHSPTMRQVRSQQTHDVAVFSASSSPPHTPMQPRLHQHSRTSSMTLPATQQQHHQAASRPASPHSAVARGAAQSRPRTQLRITRDPSSLPPHPPMQAQARVYSRTALSPKRPSPINTSHTPT